MHHPAPGLPVCVVARPGTEPPQAVMPSQEKTAGPSALTLHTVQLYSKCIIQSCHVLSTTTMSKNSAVKSVKCSVHKQIWSNMYTDYIRIKRSVVKCSEVYTHIHRLQRTYAQALMPLVLALDLTWQHEQMVAASGVITRNKFRLRNHTRFFFCIWDIFGCKNFRSLGQISRQLKGVNLSLYKTENLRAPQPRHEVQMLRC